MHDRGAITSNLIPEETVSLCKSFENLLLHAVSESTWKRHCSAWNLLRKFCDEFNLSMTVPIPIENIRAFATWAITKRNLQASTVETYISSIETAHCLAGKNSQYFMKDKCLKMILKGGENMALLDGKTNVVRLAMNVHLLKILGHRIVLENWDCLLKQALWAVCVICFYTSCRMGELVAKKDNCFDEKTTLTWENVKFLENNEALIFLPYTKTTGLKGAIVDIFPLKDTKNCPMEALKTLKVMSKENHVYSKSLPVFSYSKNKHLTVDAINKILEKIFADFTDENSKISCHSFRAAIPSAMASNPDKSTVEEIKQWGRWHSDSFEKYTRQEREKRRNLFYKTVAML